MARRNGKKGAYLMTDDYSGVTRYDYELKRDYWGQFTKYPLERNLQEIATPLNDPEPVSNYRGPQYEYSNSCDLALAPQFVGNTNVPTSTANMAMQVLGLQDGIPNMTVGCSFEVA